MPSLMYATPAVALGIEYVPGIQYVRPRSVTLQSTTSCSTTAEYYSVTETNGVEGLRQVPGTPYTVTRSLVIETDVENKSEI